MVLLVAEVREIVVVMVIMVKQIPSVVGYVGQGSWELGVARSGIKSCLHARC